MTDRQHIVSSSSDDVDVALAAFVADVVELAGLFRRVADDAASTAGLTQSLWYCLSVFSAAPTTVAQAARRLGTSRQAVQRTANDLVARGLATTRPNPDHRASPFVVLTADGRAALERISAAAAGSRHDWFADEDLERLHPAHAEVQRLRNMLRETLAGA